MYVSSENVKAICHKTKTHFYSCVFIANISNWDRNIRFRFCIKSYRNFAQNCSLHSSNPHFIEFVRIFSHKYPWFSSYNRKWFYYFKRMYLRSQPYFTQPLKYSHKSTGHSYVDECVLVSNGNVMSTYTLTSFNRNSQLISSVNKRTFFSSAWQLQQSFKRIRKDDISSKC